MEQREFVDTVAQILRAAGLSPFSACGRDGDFAGRAAVFPFEVNFDGARGIAVFEFDVRVENLLAVFHFYEFGFGLLGLAGIESAREGRIGVEAIHAIEDEKIFAGANVIEFEFAVVALKTPEAGLRCVEAVRAIEFDGRES